MLKYSSIWLVVVFTFLNGRNECQTCSLSSQFLMEVIHNLQEGK